MTSRNSFWKLSNWNFKKRIWALALCAVIWFFVLPVSVFVQIGSMMEGYQRSALSYDIDWILYKVLNSQISGNGIYGIIVAVMGVFLALQGFSWNNHQSRVDLYKSVPVRAVTRFWYINLNSLWIFLLSFGVNLMLANTAAGIKGIWNANFVLASMVSFLMHLLLFLSSYFITLIAQSLTGNVVLGFFGASFLMLFEPICNFVGDAFRNAYYWTYCGMESELILKKCIFSPIAPYVGMYKSVSRSGLGFAEMGNYTDIWKWTLLFLAQIILYGTIAYKLYRKRPAQTGGKAMLFPKTKPVIKCAIMIVASLLFGAIFAQVDKTVWYGLFGVVCGLLISQVVLQTIMEGNFKEAIRGKVSLGVAAVISLAVYLTFALDLTGFDTYLPEEEKVAGFAFYRSNDYVYDFFNDKGSYISSDNYIMQNMQIEDEEAKHLLLSMLHNAIENDDYTYKGEDENVTGVSPVIAVSSQASAVAETVDANAQLYEDGNKKELLRIKFKLTSGREITREYYLRLDDIRECYAYLYGLPEYKESVYVVLQDFVTERFDASDNSYATYLTYGAEGSNYHTKSQEFVKKLLLAIRSDIESRSAQTILSQPPVGILDLGDNYQKDKMFADQYISMKLPVYESDKATIALLQEEGWYQSPGYQENQVAGLVISQYSDKWEGVKTMELYPGDPLFAKTVSAVFTDEATSMVSDAGAFTKPNYSVVISLNPESGSAYGYTRSGLLLTDKFPKELEKAFENIEVEKEENY